VVYVLPVSSRFGGTRLRCLLQQRQNYKDVSLVTKTYCESETGRKRQGVLKERRESEGERREDRREEKRREEKRREEKRREEKRREGKGREEVKERER